VNGRRLRFGECAHRLGGTGRIPGLRAAFLRRGLHAGIDRFGIIAAGTFGLFGGAAGPVGAEGARFNACYANA
jgi:hypothetical protein